AQYIEDAKIGSVHSRLNKDRGFMGRGSIDVRRGRGHVHPCFTVIRLDCYGGYGNRGKGFEVADSARASIPHRGSKLWRVGESGTECDGYRTEIGRGSSYST